MCLMAQSLGGNNAHYKVVISPIMTICVAYRDYMCGFTPVQAWVNGTICVI